jgi:hypothetical protein
MWRRFSICRIVELHSEERGQPRSAGKRLVPADYKSAIRQSQLRNSPQRGARAARGVEVLPLLALLRCHFQLLQLSRQVENLRYATAFASG